jgi:16S rRNA (uracil1498-N3)-methyltransferase
MTRKCFFLEALDPKQEFVTLTGAVAHHIESVLRLRPGDLIELRDGTGGAWRCEIAGGRGGAVLIRLLERQSEQNESRLKLTLALAFSQLDRMDMVLRQATEMGVCRFIAFRAARSQYTLSGTQVVKRLDRWSRITRDALCQCERTLLPEIRIFSSLMEFLENVSSEDPPGTGLRVFAREDERENSVLSLWRSFPECSIACAVVGPEGGWTELEKNQLMAAKFIPIHLGPRTLRLETASVAFLASLQILWGDFS